MKTENLAIQLLKDTLADADCFLEYVPTLQNYMNVETYNEVFQKASEQRAHIQQLLELIEEHNILGESDD